LGPAAIEHAAPARVIAIGGVSAARVETCRDAGAWGVAAIAALWTVTDPHAVATRMLLCLAGTTDTPE
jgi:thiamine monophosphate synthase